MATKRQFEDFIQHPGWTEMKQLLTDRLMIVRNELEDEQCDEIETAVRRGECKNIRFVLGLPDMLMKDTDNKQEEKEEEDNG